MSKKLVTQLNKIALLIVLVASLSTLSPHMPWAVTTWAWLAGILLYGICQAIRAPQRLGLVTLLILITTIAISVPLPITWPSSSLIHLALVTLTWAAISSLSFTIILSFVHRKQRS